MRVLILLFSISLSSSVWACQQPITINYAPFVSLLVVKKFFGSFHEQLQQTSGCAVSYVIQRNFDEFVAGSGGSHRAFVHYLSFLETILNVAEYLRKPSGQFIPIEL